MLRIAIVGGGLSGRLVALNLLRLAPPGRRTHIRLYDRGRPGSMGPAYSGDSDEPLLNVPAELMGPTSDDPDAFRRWVAARGRRAEPGDFLPRRLLREYVFELLGEAAERRDGGVKLEEASSEVVDLEVGTRGATLRIETGDEVRADRVVLALGNLPPRHPPVRDPAVLASGRYARDPWHPGTLDDVGPGEPVVFIGTGQTMVDLALVLGRRGHTGRITAISRRGLLPLPHPTQRDEYPSYFAELDGATRVRSVLRTIRTHVRRAEAAGVDPRAVIDSLRPDTQSVWGGLPEAEKRRFLRHAFRYWERIRSRIPPESQARVQAMVDQRRLRVVAGRVRDMVDKGDVLDVRYTPRGQEREVGELAARVINCIGPETDYRRVEDGLVPNLLRRGLIRPGPAGIGMDARPGGAVVSRDGRASTVLFTLGSTMKGLLWEVLGVPEIRAQAERLASRLFDPSGVPDTAAAARTPT